MTESLVSIIVPVYNTADYLEDCIHSIINQTYQNIEIIMIDDGSTDDSGKICDILSCRDQRIRVIHQDNQGSGAARNAGLLATKGKYVSFVDSDDYIHPQFIEKMVFAIDDGKYDVCCSDLQYFSNMQSVRALINQSCGDCPVKVLTQKEMILSLLHQTCECSVVNRMYKSSIIREEGLRFQKQYRFWEDMEFNLDYHGKIKSTAAVLNQYLYFARERETSQTRITPIQTNTEQIRSSRHIYEYAINKYGFNNQFSRAAGTLYVNQLITFFFFGGNFSNEASKETNEIILKEIQNIQYNLSVKKGIMVFLMKYVPWIAIIIRSMKEDKAIKQ